MGGKKTPAIRDGVEEFSRQKHERCLVEPKWCVI